MGLAAYIVLVGSMKKAHIPGYNYELLEEKLEEVVSRVIQRDPSQWASYGYRPSEFIKSRQSHFYKGNEEIIEKELDFLCETLPEGDVWPNPWSWFDQNDKYPEEYRLSTNWYKAVKLLG